MDILFGAGNWGVFLPCLQAFFHSQNLYLVGYSIHKYIGPNSDFGYWFTNNSTTLKLLRDNPATPVSHNVPFTFAINDRIMITGSYKSWMI